MRHFLDIQKCTSCILLTIRFWHTDCDGGSSSPQCIPLHWQHPHISLEGPVQTSDHTTYPAIIGIIIIK